MEHNARLLLWRPRPREGQLTLNAPQAGATTQPFRQVADHLRHLIQTGELLPGARLPAARDLAEERGVALTTAVRAVELLRSEGLVETVHGRGSYVRVPAPEFVRSGYHRYRRHPEGFAPNRDESEAGAYLDEVDRGDRSVTEATPTLAARLHVDVGEPLSVVHYRWLAAGRPTQISTQWEPLSLTIGTSAEQPASPTRGQPGVIARFDAIGLATTRVVEDVRVRLPRETERVELEMPEGVPVFEVTRTHWTVDRPIETANIIIRGDRTVLRIDQPVKD